jgi:hypothetical protein
MKLALTRLTGAIATLSLATLLVPLVARAEADVDLLARQYDDGRTYVFSPAVDASATFNNDTMTISAGSAQDILTSSSADVVTFGSKGTDSKIADRRFEYSGGFSTIIPDGTLSIGYIQSDENDYHSKTVTAGATREFNTKNTVVSFGFSSGDDNIRSSSNKSFDEFMRNQVYSLSLTQILSKISLMQLIYDFRVENGYLASPYRRAKFEDSSSGTITSRDENHPRTRNRNAFAIKYNRYIESWKSSSASMYRFYIDSWGVTSHTVETRLTKEFSTKFSLGVSLRYYMQGKARFYEDYYLDSTTPFYTGNNTLATYNSLLIGLRPSYAISDRIQVFAKLEDYEERFNGAVDAYQLTTKTDDKPLTISAKVIGLGLDAKF